jgi:hypothetical protein
MRISPLRTHPQPATHARPGAHQIGAVLPTTSVAAEILPDVDGTPSAAFYRGLSWALVPALLFWALLVFSVLLLV